MQKSAGFISTREIFKIGLWQTIYQESSEALPISNGVKSGTKQEFLNYLYPVRSKAPQGACSTRFMRAASNGVNIAKGSAGEVRAQLYAAHDIGYVNIETFKRLKGLAEECSRLVSSFTKTVKAGSLSGLQRKYEKPKDEMEEFLKEHGYVPPWERKSP